MFNADHTINSVCVNPLHQFKRITPHMTVLMPTTELLPEASELKNGKANVPSGVTSSNLASDTTNSFHDENRDDLDSDSYQQRNPSLMKLSPEVQLQLEEISPDEDFDTSEKYQLPRVSSVKAARPTSPPPKVLPTESSYFSISGSGLSRQQLKVPELKKKTETPKRRHNKRARSPNPKASHQSSPLSLYEAYGCIGDGLKRLKVPEHVIFDRWRDEYSFQASLILTNVSKHPLTFLVKTSEPEMFTISPSVGLIQPKSQIRVKFRTNRLYEFSFNDIAEEIFKVFAVPVLTSKSLDREKLAPLWKSFGTKAFPRCSAEEHTILRLYQRNAEFSVRTFFTWLRPWLSNVSGKEKEVRLNEMEYLDTMINSRGSDNADRFQGWHALLDETKSETRRLQHELRRGIAWLFISIMVVALLLTISKDAEYVPRSRIIPAEPNALTDHSFSQVYVWLREIFSHTTPQDLFSLQFWQDVLYAPER